MEPKQPLRETPNSDRIRDAQSGKSGPTRPSLRELDREKLRELWGSESDGQDRDQRHV